MTGAPLEMTVEYGVPPMTDLSLFDSPASEDGDKAASDARSLDDAIEAADAADIAVLFVRDQATEAQDRANLRLPGERDELVEAIAEVNELTVVVVTSSDRSNPHGVRTSQPVSRTGTRGRHTETRLRRYSTATAIPAAGFQ